MFSLEMIDVDFIAKHPNPSITMFLLTAEQLDIVNYIEISKSVNSQFIMF